MAPRPNMAYPKGKENTLNRYKERGTQDLRPIQSLVNASPILHVSFIPPDSPFPATLPMIGVMTSFDRPSASIDEPLDLYLHGYISGRIMNLSRSATTSEAASDNEEKGLPVTISASVLDGYVLSLTPNSHSMNYRSAVIFGYAQALPLTPESMPERLFAMEQITNNIVPGRYQHTRIPPNKGELASTQILKVKVVSGSFKQRRGGPHDDKADEEDEKVRESTWTGVLPVWMQVGEQVEGGRGEAQLPQHVKDFVREGNEERRVHAVGATEEPK